MKTLHLLFLYSHHHERQFADALQQDFLKITFLPLDQRIEEKILVDTPDVLIICDSSKEERGIVRLGEIKARFPLLPLFLIIEDPSKAYLMAALRLKATGFYTQPVDVVDFRHSLLKEISGTKGHLSIEIVRRWFGRLPQQIQHLFGLLPGHNTENKAVKEQTKNWNAPHPYLHFPKINPDAEQTYDMSVRFFGNLDLDVRGKPTPQINGKKNTAVLAYLLYHHHHLTHRELLMDKFWRDNSPSSARNSLNVAICSLRKGLSMTFPRQEVIICDQQSYGLNPEIKIVTDTEKFINFWKEGNQVESSQGLAPALHFYKDAVAYYKQEFLSNLRTENWCESERENLKEIYLYILNKLGIHYFEQKEYDTCIQVGKKMLLEDICLEEVHRKLMKCYYLLGQADLAQMQYFKCKKAMQEELNLSPSEPTVDLFKKIQNGKPVTANPEQQASFLSV